MSLFGNLIWLIFGGLLVGLGYIIGGLLMCLTIIGIPFGMQSIKIGFATLTPFGKTIVEGDNANSPLRLIFNLIWIVLFGGLTCVGRINISSDDVGFDSAVFSTRFVAQDQIYVAFSYGAS